MKQDDRVMIIGVTKSPFGEQIIACYCLALLKMIHFILVKPQCLCTNLQVTFSSGTKWGNIMDVYYVDSTYLTPTILVCVCNNYHIAGNFPRRKLL